MFPAPNLLFLDPPKVENHKALGFSSKTKSHETRIFWKGQGLTVLRPKVPQFLGSKKGHFLRGPKKCDFSAIGYFWMSSKISGDTDFAVRSHIRSFFKFSRVLKMAHFGKKR